MKTCLLPLFPPLFTLVAAGGLHASEPKVLSYGKPVSLTGTVVREFDLAFVDSDHSPTQDVKEVTRVVAEAKRKRPADESKLHEPSPHLILRLDHPVSLQVDGTQPKEANVSEIDLGGSEHRFKEKELGKARFVASGSLWHAETVHHLRPVMMNVISLEHAK